VVVPPLLASRKAEGWLAALVPTAEMPHEFTDQQMSCVNWPREAPEPTEGTAALDQVSAVVGEVIGAVRMTGPPAVVPVSTHWVGEGQAICDSAVTGLPDTVGSVSLPKVALAVGAAYISSGTVPAPFVPIPKTKQSADEAQLSPPIVATVVPGGKESSVHAIAVPPRPAAAVPAITMGPVGPGAFPVPTATQLVFEGQTTDESDARVNPLVEEGADHTAGTPTEPKPPEMTIGVPLPPVLVVPMATQPVPPDGHTRLVRPVMLAGMVAADHESTPRAEMVSVSRVAPVAVVPMATQLVAEGQAI
jgi:hypothetical protein